MLDENLPTFFIQPSTSRDSLTSTLYLSQYGADAHAAYSLRRPDPSLAASKDRYAVALFDSYNPEVLYGEVLIRPEWSQAPLSAAEMRRNGNATSSPEMTIPSDFIIHLYAPDQQVHVKQKAGSWGSSAYWEFELPEQSFRQPSGSDLDRSQRDPAATDTTPKIRFRWKKDGKLSKDLVCLLSGKSTDPVGLAKKSGPREPDIAIALFRHLKEVTIYEPNLSRVEMEDLKGLELVLLLSAIVIKDVFFGNLRELFNVLPQPKRRESAESGLKPKPTSNGDVGTSSSSKPSSESRPPNPGGPSSSTQPVSPQPTSQPPTIMQSPDPQPVDEEVARLQAQVEAERRAKERAENEEIKRIKKMLAAEEKDARRRQADVEKESERLRRLYGAGQQQITPHPSMHPSRGPRSPLPPSSHSTSGHPGPYPTANSLPAGYPFHSEPRRSPHPGPPQSPYPLQPTQSSLRPPPDGRKAASKKKSMFGLRSLSNEGGVKLNKKTSSVF
ncbi:MAG: hypothetical protein M1826_000418 [Phylliscum demangeonii]|nr:MAG: hypothetical protein M1826_000418 [Phylliscum demangeonii]